MTLTAGDLVVYGGHGVGTVQAVRPGSGKEAGAGTVVVAFGESLSVTLELEQALERLRPLLKESDMKNVGKTLRSEAGVLEQPWHKRLKTARALINTGDAIGLAEIVRDSAKRTATVTPRGDKKGLSEGERQLYLRARLLLATEIGFCQSMELDDADAWITTQLEAPV